MINEAGGKRYNTMNAYLRKRFGEKVFKVSLNGGFSCPNIDGTKGRGGCIYCSSSGSGDFAGDPALPIHDQFISVRDMISKKWPKAKYIAYFQAHTNTYAPLPVLREKYEAALFEEGVVGLSVSTRPDCISDECMEYLCALSERTYLTVELGLQTVNDKTGKLINRCHTYKDFLLCYERLYKRNINICPHIIFGLPGEGREDMMRTAEAVSELSPHAVKIHLLHVLRKTALGEMYERNEFKTMSREEYVDIVCDALEIMPPETVIERLTGDGKREELIAPLWSLKKFCVLNEIDKEMRRRNSYQGIKKQN